MNSSARKTVPLHQRLEYSCVGVILGGLVLLLWGVLDHADDYVSAGISAFSVALICLVVLRVAGWSRARES